MTVQPLFDDAAERLLAQHLDVQPGRMFASDGLKTGDKFFAMVSKGDLVLKLPEDAASCETLITEARDFVKGLQARTS